MIWSEFFYMGGYAFEVWTSWGLTLFVLIAFVIVPKRRNAKIKANVKRQISREQRDDGGDNSRA